MSAFSRPYCGEPAPLATAPDAGGASYAERRGPVHRRGRSRRPPPRAAQDVAPPGPPQGPPSSTSRWRGARRRSPSSTSRTSAWPASGLTLDNVTATVVALGLNAAAYMAEIYRAGIESVHGGQREAAMSLGMTPAPGDAVHRAAAGVAGGAAAGREPRDRGAEGHVAGERDRDPRAHVTRLRPGRPDLAADAHLLLVAVMYMAMCLPLAQLVRQLERSVKRSDVPDGQGSRIRRMAAARHVPRSPIPSRRNPMTLRISA